MIVTARNCLHADFFNEIRRPLPLHKRATALKWVLCVNRLGALRFFQSGGRFRTRESTSLYLGPKIAYSLGNSF